jgi:hypothetical protein
MIKLSTLSKYWTFPEYFLSIEHPKYNLFLGPYFTIEIAYFFDNCLFLSAVCFSCIDLFLKRIKRKIFLKIIWLSRIYLQIHLLASIFD